MRHELAEASATFAFRQAARQEQTWIYELAGYSSVEKSVVALLPQAIRSPFSDMIAGLHSLYILGGIDQYYLVHYGAPYDMRTAIWHYNLDYDYVDAVELFARAYRADPAWLERMYYWDTFG